MLSACTRSVVYSRVLNSTAHNSTCTCAYMPKAPTRRNVPSVVFSCFLLHTLRIRSHVLHQIQDTALQIVTVVRMPPQFDRPTPEYNCVGGLYDKTKYRSLIGCQSVCEAEGSGMCKPTRYNVVIGGQICFTVRAISLEPDSTIEILFLTEGTGFISPPETRVVVSATLPTIALVEKNGVLVETLVRNPVERNWCFTPNSIDARMLYQSCFIAYNIERGMIPSAVTPVYCIEVFVLPTNPIFDNPSPANNSVIEGYVGCNFLFHMAALKNDTASYVLMVFPTGILNV